MREAVRVLRRGGQLVVGHWDWDSQLFDGSDWALVRRLVHASADWQQAWMAHAGRGTSCDLPLHRRLVQPAQVALSTGATVSDEL